VLKGFRQWQRRSQHAASKDSQQPLMELGQGARPWVLRGTALPNGDEVEMEHGDKGQQGSDVHEGKSAVEETTCVASEQE
jgi:hypothetical protein